MSAAAVPSSEQREAAPSSSPPRVWLALAGALLTVASLLPPIETLAHRYVYAATIQFAVFAVIAPVLLVLGAPWKRLLLSSAGLDGAEADGAFDRLARARAQHRGFIRAGVFLLAFMAAALAWRLPPIMNALVSQPALVVLEMATLLATGTALWLELLSSPPLSPRLPRPQRAAIAAMAMWFIWIVAYVVGMNTGPVFDAYASAPHHSMSIMADQEIAAGIMWLVAAIAFIPVVLSAMLGWIASDSDEELQRRMARDENQRTVVRGWGRPTADRRSL